jgi:hypothetical protein
MATAEAHAVPQDWDINTSALVTSNEPEKIYREYDYLRTHCPVAHVDKHDGYWVLTRYLPPPQSSPVLHTTYDG